MQALLASLVVYHSILEHTKHHRDLLELLLKCCISGIQIKIYELEYKAWFMCQFHHFLFVTLDRVAYGKGFFWNLLKTLY